MSGIGVHYRQRRPTGPTVVGVVQASSSDVGGRREDRIEHNRRKRRSQFSVCHDSAGRKVRASVCGEMDLVIPCGKNIERAARGPCHVADRPNPGNRRLIEIGERKRTEESRETGAPDPVHGI